MANVLFLEDDPAHGALMRAIAQEAGHRAIVVEAIDAIPGDESWDIVVSDLPPMKHYQLDQARAWVDRVRSRCACSVIICTSQLPASADVAALAADAVIRKPFDIDDLLFEIARLTS